MGSAERTYSFRARGDLADRIRDAGGVLDAMAEAEGAQVAEKVARQLVLALLRGDRRFADIRDNQSALMREAIELVVDAVEKVASDLDYAEAYAAAADRTADEDEFLRGGRDAVAARWRD